MISGCSAREPPVLLGLERPTSRDSDANLFPTASFSSSVREQWLARVLPSNKTNSLSWWCCSPSDPSSIMRLPDGRYKCTHFCLLCRVSWWITLLSMLTLLFMSAPKIWLLLLGFGTWPGNTNWLKAQCMDFYSRFLERLLLSNPLRLGLDLNPDVVEPYMDSFVPILFLMFAQCCILIYIYRSIDLYL